MSKRALLSLRLLRFLLCIAVLSCCLPLAQVLKRTFAKLDVWVGAIVAVHQQRLLHTRSLVSHLRGAYNITWCAAGVAIIFAHA